ncbi:hypothetical protein, partial [Burkholderia vietnamiensis]|uniref:hypothetical protein n=1 Tax=Burkholderia vietnamiensis TaxID=60552 RepID=UPI001ABB6F7C
MSDQKRQNMHESYEYPFPDRPQTVPTGARRTGMGPCQGERGFLVSGKQASGPGAPKMQRGDRCTGEQQPP